MGPDSVFAIIKCEVAEDAELCGATPRTPATAQSLEEENCQPSFTEYRLEAFSVFLKWVGSQRKENFCVGS